MMNQLQSKRPALLIEVLSSGAADEADRLTLPFGYGVYRFDQDGPRRLNTVARAPSTNLSMCSPETAERLIEKPENSTAPTA
jgi:hypothetical protein